MYREDSRVCDSVYDAKDGENHSRDFKRRSLIKPRHLSVSSSDLLPFPSRGLLRTKAKSEIAPARSAFRSVPFRSVLYVIVHRRTLFPFYASHRLRFHGRARRWTAITLGGIGRETKEMPESVLCSISMFVASRIPRKRNDGEFEKRDAMQIACEYANAE